MATTNKSKTQPDNSWKYDYYGQQPPAQETLVPVQENGAPKNQDMVFDPKTNTWTYNGKPWVPENQTAKNKAAATGVQQKQLYDSLVNQGYDPARAQELANMLLANAMNIPEMPTQSVGLVQPGSAQAGQAARAADIPQLTLQDVMTSGVGIGPTDPTTRDVQDEELISHQLGLLMDKEGPYLQRARQRAIELANARGQLGSSFTAGAAQRAAIEAALPIATGDAQAYRDAYTQNMNALNEFALANLQRATQLELGLMDANTRINMANLDAEVRTNLANLDALTNTNIANLDAQTRVSLGNLQSQTQLALQRMQDSLQLTLQGREMSHQVGMEQLMQTGRVELAQLDIEARRRLQEAGFTHDLNMNNLDYEQTLQVNEILNQYQLERDSQTREAERRSQHANLAMQAQINYINYMAAYANTDMDANAAKRLAQDAWNNLQAEFDMINGLYPEFDPITPKRG